MHRNTILRHASSMGALLGLLALNPAALAGVADATTETLKLYAGAAPGSQNANQRETTEVLFGEPKLRNVTRPRLTVFHPAAGRANGTAVIVAPGGAFEFLSITSEGEDVARVLARRGITAVLLRYRLNETSADSEVFRSQVTDAFSRSPKEMSQTSGAQQAIADGAQAVRLVRQQARAWHLDPGRVGFIGFSSGAVMAIHLALRHDVASRPDFVASIYGAMPEDMPVPVDAPPLFLAVAADDPGLGGASMPIFQAWRSGGHEAELHIFQSGGHGFGLHHQGTSSDHWIDEYLWWLESQGLLKRKG